MRRATSETVVIPLWLRAAGVIVAATIAVLAVVTGTQTGGATRRDQPSPPTATTGRVPPGPTAPATTAQAPALPSPLPALGYTDPRAVASSFVAAYLTWRFPDGPPGAAARVQPYATGALFEHFPEPTDTPPAPSAIAVIASATVASSTASSRVIDVDAGQHLLAQDGGALAASEPVVMRVTVEMQGGGGWLVASFAPG